MPTPDEPRLVSEITSGAGFSLTSDQAGVAETATRVFRILRYLPNDYTQVDQACGVYIGDPYVSGSGLVCNSVSAEFEGESRLVLRVTFQYRTKASSQGSSTTSQQSGGTGQQDSSGAYEDPESQPPDVRPGNLTVSASLMEVPSCYWSEADANTQSFELAVNPAKDPYVGLTELMPIVNIQWEQFAANDPTQHLTHAGSVNNADVTFGQLTCPRGSLMFRGVQFRPVVEKFGLFIYRGWKATYEFAYRRQFALIGENYVEVGWDKVVPLSGYSVIAFDPATGGINRDPYGQPLKHDATGKIKTPLELPDEVQPGQKVRAMVRVFSYEGEGASQSPSASPIALNLDGTPRDHTSTPPVLVKRYRTQKEIDFQTAFSLRLYD